MEGLKLSASDNEQTKRRAELLGLVSRLVDVLRRVQASALGNRKHARTLLFAQLQMAKLQLDQGSPEEAVRTGDEARQLYLKCKNDYSRETELGDWLEDRIRLVIFLTELTVVFRAASRLDLAQASAQQALDLSQEMAEQQLIGEDWVAIHRLPLARYFLVAGQCQLAEDQLQRARAVGGKVGDPVRLGIPDPIYLENAWYLVTCPQTERRNPAEALKLLGRVRLAGNRGWDYHSILGVTHYRAGNGKDAIQELTGALEHSEANTLGAGFFLSMALWREGDAKAARDQFTQAARWMDRFRPRDAELMRFRGEASDLLGVAKPLSPR